MKGREIKRGDLVRMSKKFISDMLTGESKDHINEFKDCFGRVEGPCYPNGEGPELDVRWIPSGLKYGYHPENLEKCSKEDYIRKKIEDYGCAYFVDATKADFPIIRCEVEKILYEGKEICKIRIPEEYFKYFRYPNDTTLCWNDFTKHLYLRELTHRAVNISDQQFAWNFNNALTLRKKIIQKRIDEHYNEVKNLIITQNQIPFLNQDEKIQ
jgi:hypothetical protein